MFCKKCGNEIDKDSKFCEKCGAAVSEETTKNNNQTFHIKSGFPWWGKVLIIIAIVFVSLIVLSTILFLIAPLL